MKRLRLIGIGASILGIGISGFVPPLSTFVSAQPAQAVSGYYVPRSMDELQQLTAPIALYPDAVLAQVLVAATYPDDVVDANRWLSAGNNPILIDQQPWDLSVKGVARYPGTLNYMAAHVDWMNDLGDAFLNQQSDVMTSVQNLRGQANACGNLVSNDQQQVIADSDVIEIVPTNPETIYVPVYDPGVIYVQRPWRDGRYLTPLETFGLGIAVGDWLHHDCDWRDRTVYVGSWGHDRPWWHHEDRDHHVRHYGDVRPGTFHNTTIINNRTEVRNNVTNVQVNRWQRDAKKPAPHATARTNRPANARPGSGYPPVGNAGARRPDDARNGAIPNGTRGPLTARESNRGQQSRESRPATPAPAAHPAPAPAAHPAPAPAAHPVERVQPEARPAPAPAPAARPAPPPPPRQSAPVRGGAAGGYQNGAAASHASNRGQASRGGHR